VSEITCSNININFLLFITDRWLKRGSLRKQSSTTIASTSVTDVVSESQRFMSPSSIGSFRIAESSKKRKYTRTMIPICSWVLCIQVIKLPLMHYASCATICYQKVLCYLQNFVDIVILITLDIRAKILVFQA
jgi:hypothetical protein